MTPVSFPAPTLILWAATVRARSLTDRLIVGQTSGCTEQSVFPDHITNWLAKGQTLTQIREQARVGGVPITILDPLTRWLPNWRLPAYMNAEERAFQETDQNTFFEYAAGLQVKKMSVIDGIGARVDLSEIVLAFERMCDKARELGMLVQVEFMPFGSIPDLATAWEIVRRANRENGGLVFDTYHYFRGYPDPNLLAQLPGEKVFAVQASDAGTAIQGGSLYADQMHFRQEPGQGNFPLIEIIRTLRAIGGLRNVGAELFSDEADRLTPAVLGAQVGEALRQLLNAAEEEPA
ncbi:sugar phosphate isomerase/epimerase [uncultured Mucilaginibacter sp.]|uniref:sugar phosphate isomerase/epimerase family protein n=1 Tax=uncultured Mucilaginibacter sp. TaxID=797541 RepID=UPI00261AC362|nr:sugar phosphate isomerase/epimerase [uncultured Mucilaginibacter sp.]